MLRPARPSPVLLLVLAACGGGGGEETPSGGTAAEDRTHPPPGSDELPPAPERVFASQLPRVGPGYPAVAARVDPAYSDPANGVEAWDEEVVARLTERAVGGALSAALEGSTAPWESLLASDVRPAATLRPEAPDTLRADAAATVTRGVETTPGGAVEEELERLLAPYRGADASGVDVDCTSVRRTGPRKFTVRARARVWAHAGAEGRQAGVVWDLVWRVAQRPRIVEWTPRAFEEVALPRRPFVDATRTALADAPAVRGELGLGALELAGRTDRLVPSSVVYLGMHGAAVGDLDGDGWEDLVVGRQAGLPNQVLMGGPGGVAREEAAARGLDFLDDTGGVLVVDLDGDGARDVAMGRGIDVVIAWNDGSGRFPGTTVLRRTGSDRVYSLCAADADGDGDLDLYDTRYFRRGGYGAEAPTPYHDATNGAPNFFWRNRLEEEPRRFEEDTKAVGLHRANDRFSLAATWDDFDLDGDLDLYVANDFGRNNLYRNDGGTFEDVAGELGLDDRAAGMGISVADADLDGDVDVLVSNMYSAAGVRVTAHPRFMPRAPVDVRASYARHARGNTLLAGRGDGRYLDVTDRAGVGPGGWAWGARFHDWDLDGLPDMVVPNGFLSGRAPDDLASFFWREVVGSSPDESPGTPRYLEAWATITHLSQIAAYGWSGPDPFYGYLNLGGLDFADATFAAGLGVRDDARATVACDWDGDGTRDLWCKNRTSPALRLLAGRRPPDARWIAFELRGHAPNTDAVGALVRVEAGGVERTKRITAGDGFLGGSSLRAHFGLGASDAVDAVSVAWPDGTEEAFGAVEPGRVLVLAQGAGEARVLRAASAPIEADAAPPADAAPGPPRVRVPLLDVLPLGAARLPSFGGGARRVDELAGDGGLLVPLWHAGHGASVEALRAIAARSDDFDAYGVTVHPLNLDGVRHADVVERLARSLGLPSPGGRADRSARTVVEMLLGQTIAPFDDLPLPLALLCDARGDVACLYVGGLPLDDVLADAEALAERSEEGRRWPTVLTGGFWDGLRPERPLERLPEVLRSRGLEELAAAIEAEHDRREAAAGR